MEKLQTFFKKSNWKFNKQLFSFGTGPEADWKIILILSIVLALLVVAISIFIFIKIDKGEIFTVNKSLKQGEEILDVTLLNETVSYYQNKALEFERIKKVGIPSVDPSR